MVIVITIIILAVVHWHGSISLGRGQPSRALSPQGGGGRGRVCVRCVLIPALSLCSSASLWMTAQPFPPHTCSLGSLLSTAEKLLAFKDQDWNDFLQQVCSQIDSSEKSTGTLRAKLNLLCYLCVVATHKEVATRLLHSPLVGTAGWTSLPGTHYPVWLASVVQRHVNKGLGPNGAIKTINQGLKYFFIFCGRTGILGLYPG